MAEQEQRQRPLERLSKNASEVTSLVREGKYGEAERFQQQILEDNCRLLGPEDRETRFAKGQLAFIFWHQGRYEDAENEQKELTEIYLREYGWLDDHTLGLTLQLVNTYLSQHKLEESEPLARELLHHQGRYYGRNSPECESTQRALATIATMHGRIAEAAVIEERILQSSISRSAPSITTAMGYHRYGKALIMLNKLDEAEQNLVRALELGEATVGPEDDTFLDVLATLASLHFNRGDSGRAIEVASKVAKSLEESLGETHSSTIGSESDLAACLLSDGQQEASRAKIDRAVAFAHRCLQPEDPQKFLIFSNAASIYEDLQLHDLAFDLAYKSYKFHQETSGNFSESTLSAMSQFGRTLVHQGKMREAEGKLEDAEGKFAMADKCLDSCVERTRRTYGSEHPYTARRAAQLADLRKRKLHGKPI